jgi:hypothetical protein
MPPYLQPRTLRLALIGDKIDALKLLLEDVLRDTGIRYELITAPSACDAIIVMVRMGAELREIADARALMGNGPLIAILPFSEESLIERVLLGGVQSWYALDTPLALLQLKLVKLSAVDSPL